MLAAELGVMPLKVQVYMKVTQNHITERKGIAAIQIIVLELDWLFREQPISDYGIDAHLEIVENQTATGRLLGLQIKSGSNYFKEKTPDGFVFRGNLPHLKYWLSHTLPVLVILHNPEKGVSYWQVVQTKTIEMTEGAWKMIIPYANIFSFSSAENLKEIAGIAPSTNRLNALQTAYEWMLLLATGKRILLEVDEWVNKSSGRNDFRLIVQSQDGSEKTIYAWPFLLLRGISYEQFIPDFFPWADFWVVSLSLSGTFTKNTSFLLVKELANGSSRLTKTFTSNAIAFWYCFANLTALRF